jgi:hypothetical protein
MTPKLEIVRAILMCVLDFGGMEIITGNRPSKDPLSSPRMFSTRNKVNCLSFQINFFVWDKTMMSSTFALKSKKN